MLRRTFLAMFGFGGIRFGRRNMPHITWRVLWWHVRGNDYKVTVYLYGENEPQPSLIFTNKGGEYLAWRLRQVCEEGTLTDPKPVDDMPMYVRDLLRVMTYGVDVIVGDRQ